MFIKPISSERATLHPEIARKIRAKILKWGEENYQNYPWRTPKNKWHGLIAEIMLQRTRAKNVVLVYENFIAKFVDPCDLANAPLSDIEEIVFPLGLRWRTPLLKKLGEQLCFRGSIVPEDYDTLLNLPGVGDYVASAWLSFHGGKRRRLIDANVVRFICRVTDNTMNGETRRQKWMIDIAELLTPKRKWRSFNFAILDFTMRICAKKPLCHICPIGPKLCKYGNQILINKDAT